MRGGGRMGGWGGEGRRENGNGYQRCRTRINELMLRASRHDY